VNTHKIQSESELKDVLNGWAALHSSVGQSPFTDPGFFEAWWDNYGRCDKRALLNITIGLSGGRLVALAPLVVVRRFGFRFLEWAGANVFDYQDLLLEDHADKRFFWEAIRDSRTYDLAFMRSIGRNAASYEFLSEAARPARSSTGYSLALEWNSEQDWMKNALSRSRRQQLRRKRRLLQERGDLNFQVHSSGSIPTAVFESLLQQKLDWAVTGRKGGLFGDPDKAMPLLRRLARAAQESGTLHLSWLSCDNAIIAAHFGFLHHNKLHYYIPSYSREWREFSPGDVLLSCLIGWCIDNNVSALDFMKGDHGYKLSYANERTELVDFLFPGSIIGGIAEWALRNLYFCSPLFLFAFSP
jgi:CelD/BcsL family acetyltransferase involved in cellulose biosynthesis